MESIIPRMSNTPENWYLRYQLVFSFQEVASNKFSAFSLVKFTQSNIFGGVNLDSFDGKITLNHFLP